MTTWKKYGGTTNMEKLNNISVYSIASDVLTLRQGYYGSFDICGELHVSGRVRFDGEVDGRDLYISNSINTQTLTVNSTSQFNNAVDISGNLSIHNGGVFIANNLGVSQNLNLTNQLFLGDSSKSYIFGTPTIGNIGLNTTTPISAVDISSSQSLAFNVGSSQRSELYSVLSRNNNDQAISFQTTPLFTQIGFNVDSSASSFHSDGSIKYEKDGVLTLDVSDNTNILSRLAVSNRHESTANHPQHIMGETAVIYDISAGKYLYPIYENTAENTGNALSLIATDASSNTFLNIITPQNKGVSIGGGVYPNDQTRSMATIGLRDSSANYTPAMNIVSGKSGVKHKTTVAINTHSPDTENYVFDINGPVHIRNGELTISKQPEFEVLYLTTGKTAPNYGVAIGTPYTVESVNGYYSQQILYTSDSGETWKTSYDLSGTIIESVDNNGQNYLKSAYVVDSSLTILGGDLGYAVYSYQGGVSWQPIFIPYSDPGMSIDSIYVSSSKRCFCGFNDINGGQSFIYWFDLSSSIYTDNNGITSEDGAHDIFYLPATGLTSIDGADNLLWIVYGSKISKYANVNNAPTFDSTYNANIPLNSIFALDSSTVIACGEGIITYSTNGGGSWTNVSIPGLTINSIRLLDRMTGMAVCNGGKILISRNGFSTWTILDNSAINESGNANRLLDSRFNLTNLGIVDSNNFYFTKTITSYESGVRKGNTSIFHAYLPNLFNNKTNMVFDIDGTSRIAGDLWINNAGAISSNNSEFRLLNTGVNQIFMGNDASSIILGGNAATNMVTANRNLSVLGNASIQGNTIIQGNATISNAFSVIADTSLNSNLTVGANTTLRNNLNVPNGIATINKLAVSTDSSFSSNLVVGNVATIIGKTILSDASINGNVFIAGTQTISGVLIGNSNVQLKSNIDVSGNLKLDGNLTTPQAIYAGFYEGQIPTIHNGGATPDINIGGILNSSGIPMRYIRIGNFASQVDTSNIILMGGKHDTIVIQGSMVNNQDTKMGGTIIYLNSTGLNDSAGAGITIGANGQEAAGYIAIANDYGGYKFKPTSAYSNNVVKLDVVNTILPEGFSTGLMSVYRTPNVAGADSNYTLAPSTIDPSNILLKNGTTSTAKQQVIDTSLSVLGTMSIGTKTGNPNYALEISGNVSHSNGLIWQF